MASNSDAPRSEVLPPVIEDIRYKHPKIVAGAVTCRYQNLRGRLRDGLDVALRIDIDVKDLATPLNKAPSLRGPGLPAARMAEFKVRLAAATRALGDGKVPTAVRSEMAAWVQAVADDLGGEENLSEQQRTI